MQTITYNGLERVREMTYNSLRADRLLRIYEIAFHSLNELFSDAEAASLRRQFVERGIHVRELTNENVRRQVIGVPGFDELLEVRYIDPRHVAYATEIIIYNDVVGFYTYGQDAYGLEIHDANFARVQAQLFDQMWDKVGAEVTMAME